MQTATNDAQVVNSVGAPAASLTGMGAWSPGAIPAMLINPRYRADYALGKDALYALREPRLHTGPVGRAGWRAWQTRQHERILDGVGV